MENELEKQIGTKESVKLSAGSIVITKVTIDLTKGGKAKVVNLHCLHADAPSAIKISKVKTKKIQGNNETLKVDTLWWNLDDDGNIKKNSSVADLLRYYGKPSVLALENTSVTTEADAQGFLCVKAY